MKCCDDISQEGQRCKRKAQEKEMCLKMYAYDAATMWLMHVAPVLMHDI